MNKLYVLIRQDLPKNYQAVQAGHAVAEFLCAFPLSIWRNEILIYLKAEDEKALMSWADNLEKAGCIGVPFREPDLADEITALAFLSTPASDKLMEGVKLI